MNFYTKSLSGNWWKMRMKVIGQSVVGSGLWKSIDSKMKVWRMFEGGFVKGLYLHHYR